MNIKVKAGSGAVIGTHIGSGSDRRALYITPWGVFLDTPAKAPEDADLTPREYIVSAGPLAGVLRDALKDGHPLASRIEIVEPAKAKEPAKASEPKEPKAPKAKASEPKEPKGGEEGADDKSGDPRF